MPFYLFVCLFSFEVKTFLSTFSMIGEYTCMKLQLKTFLFLFFLQNTDIAYILYNDQKPHEDSSGDRWVHNSESRGGHTKGELSDCPKTAESFELCFPKFWNSMKKMR